MNQVRNSKEMVNEREAIAPLPGNRIPDHRHNGLDYPRIRMTDLDTVLYKEAVINPGNLLDGAGETVSVAVKKAALGDFVMVSAPYDLQDVTVTAYVQAADTVEIRIQNESGGSRDLASGTWRVLVIKVR